jgi:NAD(P)H-flavin reductase
MSTDTIPAVRVLSTREVVRATPRTRIVRLDIGFETFQFEAGQAIVVGLHNAPFRKPYSIACSPRQALQSGALELLVQIDNLDEFDPHIERLSSGDTVDVEGPFGTFGIPRDIGENEILFVAGGTGIAPIRGMLWDAIEHRPTSHLALIYSVRSADEIAYEEELRKLAENGRLDLRVTLTRDGPASWLGPRGRINEALIQHVIRTEETRCVLCGPQAMINDVTALLLGAGVSIDRIVTETFST